jgi:hypothetical protein
VTRKRTVCRQRKDTVTVKVELECNRDECQPECPGQSNRRVSGPGRAANGSLSVSDNDLESKPERHWHGHWQAQAPGGPASLSDSEGPRFRMHGTCRVVRTVDHLGRTRRVQVLSHGTVT